MTSDEAVIAVIDALGSLAVPYLLTGSLASNFYGIPRATQDADFVVHLEKLKISAILQQLGPRFRLDPQMGFETVTATARYSIRALTAPLEIELYLLSDDEHDRERFRRRRRIALLGRSVWVPTAEDVIVTKLRWSLQGRRPKDRDDVRNVLAVQADRIDWDYVYPWCDRHGTRELLDHVRGSIPPP